MFALNFAVVGQCKKAWQKILFHLFNTSSIVFFFCSLKKVEVGREMISKPMQNADVQKVIYKEFFCIHTISLAKSNLLKSFPSSHV